MQHALRVNFENFGHTTKNKTFRLVKLLADLSTRLKDKIIDLTSKNMENIFTDGSVSENCTGSAFANINFSSVKSLYSDKKLSSLTAELTGLEKAIDFGISKKFSKITILTDSLDAIQTIKNADSKNCIS